MKHPSNCPVCLDRGFEGTTLDGERIPCRRMKGETKEEERTFQIMRTAILKGIYHEKDAKNAEGNEREDEAKTFWQSLRSKAFQTIRKVKEQAMKKFLLVALALVSTTAFAQQGPTNDFLIKRATGPAALTVISGKAYTTSTSDTTMAYACSDWKSFFVTVQSRDSASILIKYQISADSGGGSAINWSAIATKDSLSTTNNAGDAKSVDVSGQILGAKWVRFIFAGNSGATQGTTTNTYEAIFKRYPY